MEINEKNVAKTLDNYKQLSDLIHRIALEVVKVRGTDWKNMVRFVIEDGTVIARSLHDGSIFFPESYLYMSIAGVVAIEERNRSNNAA